MVNSTQNIFRKFDDLLEGNHSLVAMSIYIKFFFKKFKDRVYSEFLTSLENLYDVYVVDGSVNSKSPSKYVYICTKWSGLDSATISDIVDYTERVLFDYAGKNTSEECSYSYSELIRLADDGIVKLKMNSSGVITEVNLMNCLLLIRIGDHNKDSKDIKTKEYRKRYEVRSSIVEKFRFFNVDDALSPIPKSVLNTVDAEDEDSILQTYNNSETFMVNIGREKILYWFDYYFSRTGIKYNKSILEDFLNDVLDDTYEVENANLEENKNRRERYRKMNFERKLIRNSMELRNKKKGR